jgi:hypothetical protein
MTREELIAAMQATAAQKPRAVEVKGWGTVYVRSPTVEEVDADVGAQGEDEDGAPDKRRIARGAARMICDEQGRRIFDPSNPADLDLLAKQPWPMLRLITSADEEPPGGNSASAKS